MYRIIIRINSKKIKFKKKVTNSLRELNWYIVCGIDKYRYIFFI